MSIGKGPALYPRMSAKPPFSVEVPGQTPVEGETPVRRHPVSKNEIYCKPADNISTTYELVRESVAKYGNAKIMGTRKLVNTHQETKKVKKIVDGEEREVDKSWTFFELGPYEYMTFNEYEQLMLQVGSGLRNVGLVKDDRVHLFAGTSQNWLAMSHGAASQDRKSTRLNSSHGE